MSTATTACRSESAPLLDVAYCDCGGKLHLRQVKRKRLGMVPADPAMDVVLRAMGEHAESMAQLEKRGAVGPTRLGRT
ncbi:hypothetical protein GCM10010425_54760 [Streptomyces spororaveus]|uniref:Uncharacterized protein n=1 Tax=Streptomyces spororaveus TaxID=284039 RepID=A0ABQ3TAB3_9ACTN|nr:hypothetical protein [Streptomyces spororaveus]GHI77326.1 hypothetical protein Sspor_28870 [Streptomyces spororaveus]